MGAWPWLLLLALISFAGGLATGWSLLEHLAYATVALDLLALGSAKLSGRGLSLEATVDRRRTQMAGTVRETFTVQRKGLWPAFWLVLETSEGRRVPLTLAGRSLTITLERTLERRGVHFLAQASLRVRDPFGLVSLTRAEAPGMPVTVYPRPLASISANRFLSSWTRKRERIRLQRGDLPIGDLRPYQPRDPISRIHWKSTARTGQMLVTELDRDRDEVVWLLVDASGSQSEECLSIAAFLLERLGRSRARAGLVVCGQVTEVAPPSHRPGLSTTALDALAYAETAGSSRIPQLLEETDREGALVLVTAADPDDYLPLRRKAIAVVGPDIVRELAA